MTPIFDVTANYTVRIEASTAQDAIERVEEDMHRLDKAEFAHEHFAHTAEEVEDAPANAS